MYRFAAVLLIVLSAPLHALACQPARIDLSVDSGRPAVVGAPLHLNLKIKDESGQFCPADRNYVIHLEASNSRGEAVALSQSDVLIPRHHSDPNDEESSVTVQVAGLVTIRATSPPLRAGIASVFVHKPYRRNAEIRGAFLLPAAFVKASTDVMVIAHCASGGEVSANGADSITVMAELENGPVPYPVRLQFARGPIEWDGVIAIPAGAASQGVEIRSHRTGPVSLRDLLSSDPSALRLDPDGKQSCDGVRFISPAQYADLEFETARISYGEPVQLSVIFRDREYNAVPIEDGSQAGVQVIRGRQPSLTEPVLQKGAASLICKPNWWGRYEFRLTDASLKTISRSAGETWIPGAVALTVTFPWIPLFFCFLFGSLGAGLFALYKREGEIKKVGGRIALGVGAAILIVSLTLEASLLKPAFQPYTPLILALSLVAGWCGPAVFNWYAAKLGIVSAGPRASVPGHAPSDSLS